ncbi:hypothetical protein [Bacteroides acidifaciens]|uniref:hypothetical protein n=1 Tax=Bacteroides acidifaciens TaxID=85831 RepID=UPI0025A558A0|nr:hypothetical protein [Bacteroides acidifaciens]
MQQLSKIVTRQDANFKLSPSASNETSINLSKEISALISDESGDATFTLYKSDFIKALSALCLIPKIYLKKEQQPSSIWSIFRDLSLQIETQFGDAETSKYTIYHFKRDDGRAYFNNLKSANGFNLRAFLVEQFAVLTFERSDDGTLSIRLNIDAPRQEETPHINLVEEEPVIDEPLQVIYYGAPGTGKSFTIDDKTDDKNSVRTTFHPDSDYASFVGAYKPTMENVPINSIYGESVQFATGKNGHPGTEKKIVYKYVPQAFLKAYVAAWSNLDTPYFLIIEEINRGNCAQIFGDLFQLLDRNNAGSSSYAIHADEDISQFLSSDNKGFAALSDEQKDAIRAFELHKDNGKTQAVGQNILDGKLLLLPPNLYIWATMNTSDQSLFPIDSAFKRRWNWKYMPIEYNPLDKKTQQPIDWKFQIGDNLYSWGQFLGKINPEIYTLTESSDKQMGYFFAKVDNATGIISEDVFLNKVLFYLWTDVFKDFDVSSELFKNKKANRSFRFTDFFEDSEALGNFIDNLDLNSIEPVNLAMTEDGISRLSVKFPDGTILNTGNMIDIYTRTLERIGLDMVFSVLADRKKGIYPLITKEQIAIENPGSKRRYKKVGDYYLLVGPDTYPYAGIINELSSLLSIDLNAEFE